MEYDVKIPKLPPGKDLATAKVLKQLIISHRNLGELKGVETTIPNERILIDTLTLQEAKDSSAVENIITTHDELYKAELGIEKYESPASKEVHRYAAALKRGFELVRSNRMIKLNDILKIHEELENNTAGLRKQYGTKLINESTGETVFTPPQHPSQIEELMRNLIDYINDDSLHEVDPLIKMAVIHYQFESIHSFYDANGRVGRIINILYLVLKNLLNLPVLYLSRYIIQNKPRYYELLREVHDNDNWEERIIFILKGVDETALRTIELIKKIKEGMMEYKHKIRKELPKVYSRELINNLFRYPYTKIQFAVNDLGVSRVTAAKYLGEIVDLGLLQKFKLGRSNYYANVRLFEILSV